MKFKFSARMKSYEEFTSEKKSPFKKETLDKYKREYKRGEEIPFGIKSSLIAQGLISRQGGPDKGKKIKSQAYK